MVTPAQTGPDRVWSVRRSSPRRCFQLRLLTLTQQVCRSKAREYSDRSWHRREQATRDNFAGRGKTIETKDRGARFVAVDPRERPRLCKPVSVFTSLPSAAEIAALRLYRWSVSVVRAQPEHCQAEVLPRFPCDRRERAGLGICTSFNLSSGPRLGPHPDHRFNRTSAGSLRECPSFPSRFLFDLVLVDDPKVHRFDRSSTPAVRHRCQRGARVPVSGRASYRSGDQPRTRLGRRSFPFPARAIAYPPW
jgi:hypothetical protein